MGQSAATADSLPDAINTTIAARKEAQGSEETPMDEWFYKKYARAPYTTDPYAKPTGEEQPKSYTEEDAQLDMLKELREQQEKELQQDVDNFNNRPKPPYVED